MLGEQPRSTGPGQEKSPGCGTRGSPWSGGAPVGRPRRSWLCGPATPPVLSPLALPLHAAWRPAVVQGGLTVGAASGPVKCLGQVIRRPLLDPEIPAQHAPFEGLSYTGDCVPVKRQCMLRRPYATPRRTSEHRRRPPPRGSAPRRSPAPASRRRRADADRSRRRPLLEGVHLADRARQDAPDARDDRVARAAPRRRRRLPRERRLDRRAREGRGDPRPRRGAARGAARSTRRSTSTRTRSPPSSRTGAVELQVRALSGEAWARAAERRGQARRSSCSTEARALVEGAEFSDLDRAEVLFRLGVCRYLLSSISTAVALFDEALALAERSGLPSDLLRAEHPHVALALLSAPARLRGRARGRRARARARRGDATTRARSARRTSRRR